MRRLFLIIILLELSTTIYPWSHNFDVIYFDFFDIPMPSDNQGKQMSFTENDVTLIFSSCRVIKSGDITLLQVLPNSTILVKSQRNLTSIVFLKYGGNAVEIIPTKGEVDEYNGDYYWHGCSNEIEFKINGKITLTLSSVRACTEWTFYPAQYNQWYSGIVFSFVCASMDEMFFYYPTSGYVIGDFTFLGENVDFRVEGGDVKSKLNLDNSGYTSLFVGNGTTLHFTAHDNYIIRKIYFDLNPYGINSFDYESYINLMPESDSDQLFFSESYPWNWECSSEKKDIKYTLNGSTIAISSILVVIEKIDIDYIGHVLQEDKSEERLYYNLCGERMFPPAQKGIYIEKTRNGSLGKTRIIYRK